MICWSSSRDLIYHLSLLFCLCSVPLTDPHIPLLLYRVQQWMVTSCVLLHSLPTPLGRMGHGSLSDERVVAFSGEFSFQILRRICLVQQFKQEID